MRGTRWLMVVFTLGLALLAGGIGEVAGSFTDSETSSGNGFQAWTSILWPQTTQADFEAGIPSQPDTRSSPGNVGLARDNHIFAFQGGSATFWRYGVPGNSWTSMTGAPNALGAGGALAYDGVRYIYAFQGGGTRIFWRYDATLGVWAARTQAPANVGTGGSLAYDGSRYIYAFRGNNRVTFWQYDTNNNSWAVRANAPATVRAGGSLAYDGTRYIYALRGNNRAVFWRYDTTSNSWTSMAGALGNVAGGGALAFVAASAYVSSATLASQVRDTGISEDRWDALIWDETLPANTDITFEVRASDTLFAADNVTLTWTSVGGTSPVTSGLPSGRYMQWRATLTTTDIAVTPLIHEVRLYHF